MQMCLLEMECSNYNVWLVVSLQDIYAPYINVKTASDISHVIQLNEIHLSARKGSTNH